MVNEEYRDLTRKISKAANRVHRELGFGFLERVYQNALAFELRKQGLRVETERSLTVFYRDVVVGNYFADMIVENKIILEIKTVRGLAEVHGIQLLNYLQATDLKAGLLINFWRSVTIKQHIL